MIQTPFVFPHQWFLWWYSVQSESALPIMVPSVASQQSESILPSVVPLVMIEQSESVLMSVVPLGDD